MSIQTRITKQVSSGGQVLNEQTAVTTTGSITRNESIPVAEGGSLTTRTTDDAGTITMDDSGHSVQTGDRIDIYWATGECWNCTVGTVSGTSVPFTLREGGDILPAQDTDVSVAVPQGFDVDLDGDSAKSVFTYFAKRGIAVLTGVDGVEDYALPVQGGQIAGWYYDSGEANPIAGDTIAKVFVSQSNELVVATFQLAIGYN